MQGEGGVILTTEERDRLMLEAIGRLLALKVYNEPPSDDLLRLMASFFKDSEHFDEWKWENE